MLYTTLPLELETDDIVGDSTVSHLLCGTKRCMGKLKRSCENHYR